MKCKTEERMDRIVRGLQSKFDRFAAKENWLLRFGSSPAYEKLMEEFKVVARKLEDAVEQRRAHRMTHDCGRIGFGGQWGHPIFC